MKFSKCAAVARFSAAWTLLGLAPVLAQAGASSKDFAPTDENILLAPYVWKCTGTGAEARAEAGMPGAYLKALAMGTDTISLLVDGTANDGFEVSNLPIVDYSIDGGEFKSVQLSARNEVYAVPLADGLDVRAAHRVDVFYRAGTLRERWENSKSHLRIAGLRMSSQASLLRRSRLPRNAIAFGDSITEGVLAEGAGPYYTNLFLDNARVTWVPIVCAALQAEYGQLGTGGQGMVKPIQIPPLPKTWDRYDSSSSRLVGGRLRPEPDYVFCLMGTNDSEELKKDLFARNAVRALNITDAYVGWLAVVRAACPHAAVFCITPPLGLHAQEIAAAVKTRRSAGDRAVHLIDTAPLRSGFMAVRFDPQANAYTLTKGPTQLAVDGVHPSVYGDAMLGALITADAVGQMRLQP